MKSRTAFHTRFATYTVRTNGSMQTWRGIHAPSQPPGCSCAMFGKLREGGRPSDGVTREGDGRAGSGGGACRAVGGLKRRAAAAATRSAEGVRGSRD